MTTDVLPAAEAGEGGWTTKAEANDAHDAIAAIDARENFIVYCCCFRG